MTAAAIAGALVARGMDPGEFADKHMLYHRVVELHASLRGRPPEFAWWVPGRLEVFGKHTDYAGGRTLVCAVPRGFAVVASARPDGIVHVADAWRGEDLTLRPSDPPGAQTGWRRYIDVAVHRLARNFPGAAIGADIAIASDLPRASGMSSSSALIIAIAVALGRIGSLHTHPAWKRNIRSGLDAAAYYACIENGRQFAGLAGDNGVGTHGGSEDHAAIVEARAGYVTAFAFVPPRAVGGAQVPDDWHFVIASSGIAARKTGEAMQPYNRLAAGVARLLDGWNRESPRTGSLAAALRSGPAAADRLRGLAATVATDEMPADWLRDRLDHFIREDARTEQALAAFSDADAARLGMLAADSQRDAEILLRNQVPATSLLAAAARKQGAIAACSFGAGFGGAVWALVAGSANAEAFARQWHPGSFVMKPGQPVTDLSGL